MVLTAAQHQWHLLPQRAVYWPHQQALIVADIHVGKSMHFRKAGVPVPAAVLENDLQTLTHLIQHYAPQMVIVVGDMFHSRSNTEVDLFARWRAQYAATSFTLVKGNHDILPESAYRHMNLHTTHHLLLDNVAFTHEPPSAQPGLLTLCGHLHPGVALRGMGRQHLRLPCFYLRQNILLLPAFSVFTGLHMLTPAKGAQVFAIADGKVFEC